MPQYLFAPLVALVPMGVRSMTKRMSVTMAKRMEASYPPAAVVTRQFLTLLHCHAGHDAAHDGWRGVKVEPKWLDCYDQKTVQLLLPH